MVPPHYIIVTLLLFIVAVLLGKYANKLYNKAYKKHVTFEPETAPSSRTLRRFFYGFVVYILLVALLSIVMIFQQADYLFLQRLIFGGVISNFICLIAMSVRAIFLYTYVEKKPSSISGSLVLSSNLARQEIVSTLIQLLIPVAVIMIVVPDPFIYGFALGIVMGITLFSLKLLPLRIK